MPMDDYITVLLESLDDLRPVSADGKCERLLTAEEAAATALRETLSPEQSRLFLAYEDACMAAATASADAFARQAFLLAREIFR